MKISDILANNYVVEYKEYPTQEYEGVTFTMKEKDGQLIVKPLNDYGISMGHVVFNMDGKILDPQDLVIANKYQGQGIARVMYDYIKSQGFTIERSWDQTDAGAGFWNKHRGEDVRVWEQTLSEVGDSFYDVDQTSAYSPSKNIRIKHAKGVTPFVPKTRANFKFKTDSGTQYVINLSMMKSPKNGRTGVEVVFYDDNEDDDNKIGITNKGDAVKVFSTVKAVLTKFLSEHPQASVVAFSAKTDEPSRVKLYQTFANQFTRWFPKFSEQNVYRHPDYTTFAMMIPKSVNEGSGLDYIGNCTDDDVVEHLFGDATGFAQAVEEYGDEFELDDLVVKYDPETDVHSFYYKQGDLDEGWKDWVAGAAMGAAALGAHGDAEAATKKHQVNKPAVVQQVKMQKVTPEQSRGGESPADLKAYVEAMAKKYLPANQVPQFIGQVAHETANFTSMIEQNPEKNLIHYAKAKNPLGNKGMLDAQKYIGRGFLQITGKYNYKHFGDKIRPGFGDELLKNPDLAMRKDVAIALAVYFWRERVAHKIDAGAGNKEIATAINGRKPKGLDSRAQAVKMAAANFPAKKRG